MWHVQTSGQNASKASPTDSTRGHRSNVECKLCTTPDCTCDVGIVRLQGPVNLPVMQCSGKHHFHKEKPCASTPQNPLLSLGDNMGTYSLPTSYQLCDALKLITRAQSITVLTNYPIGRPSKAQTSMLQLSLISPPPFPRAFHPHAHVCAHPYTHLQTTHVSSLISLPQSGGDPS
jgi:hypothetical protein